MRLLTSLDISKYPLSVPSEFQSIFSPEIVNIQKIIFSSNNSFDLPIQKQNSFATYSLLNSLDDSYVMKMSHSNVIKEANETPPSADAQYIILSNEELTTQTNSGKKYLAVSTADCLPIIMSFQNENYYIGAVIHAGWRGFTADIVNISYQKLKEEASRKGIFTEEFSKNLQVHIGPAIFGKDYECGLDVSLALQEHKTRTCEFIEKSNIINQLYNELIKPIGQKVFPDLQLLCAIDCVLLGILSCNIEILRENTYTHPVLHSFRGATHKKLNSRLRQWTHLKLPSMDKMLMVRHNLNLPIKRES